MIVPPFLLRLMHRMRLSAAITNKLGPEDRIAVELADACRAWTLEGRLRAVWFHIPNEGGGANRRKAQIELSIKAALGMIQGTSDLVFIGPAEGMAFDRPSQSRVLLLELKSKTGTVSANQKDFKAWAESLSITYRIARSFEQAEAILLELGLLSPPPSRSTAHAEAQRP